jgi:pimeloyl-ACP methyl ester carboxylesterase
MKQKLYLLPGTMCNHRLWTRLQPHLDSAFELVYLSIPRDMDVEQLAAHYHDIIAEDKICLIGFSLGGYIASLFATRYPERIAKLFVIANSPTALAVAELEQRSAILKFVQSHGYKGASRNKIANLFDASSQHTELIDLVQQMDAELGEAEFISQYQHTSHRVDVIQGMSGLNFPIHFYCSDQDPLVDVACLDELTAQSPQFLMHKTSGTGHMLPLEKPQQLAKHIHAWAAL